MKDMFPETAPTVMGINILLSTHELEQLEKDLTACGIPVTQRHGKKHFAEMVNLRYEMGKFSECDSPRFGKTRLQELLEELHKVGR